MPMFDPKLADRIARCGNIAVLVLNDARQGPPLARALLEGGVSVMELTLRTPAALEAIRAVRQAVPGMLVGAGTVLTPEQAQSAADAGAAFAVAPGLNPRVMERARALGLSFAPGVMTPSDIERALELDCRLMKFFPAESIGGLKTLAHMAAPYKHLGIRFIPLGGLQPDNTAAYLSHPLVAACGGSWMAPVDAIEAADWTRVRNLARQASALAQQARQPSPAP